MTTRATTTARWQRPRETKLRLHAKAWLKWQFLCHAGDTEVGMLGLARDKDDLLYVHDLVVPKQEASSVTTDFAEDAVGEAIEAACDAGLDPNQVGRVWLHTHPGASATPSLTDEQTFRDCFGGCDFAVMAILGRGATGETYARVRYKAAGKAASEFVVDVEVDWPKLGEALHEIETKKLYTAWTAEHAERVTTYTWTAPVVTSCRKGVKSKDMWRRNAPDYKFLNGQWVDVSGGYHFADGYQFQDYRDLPISTPTVGLPGTDPRRGDDRYERDWRAEYAMWDLEDEEDEALAQALLEKEFDEMEAEMRKQQEGQG